MFWRRSERERDRERNRRREETLDRLVGLDPEQRSAVVAEAVMAGEIDRHEADDLLRTAARLQAVDTMTLSGWSAALAGRVHDELASGLTDVSPAAPLGEIAIDPWAYSDEDELIAIPIEPAYPPAYEAAYPARYEVAYETEYDEATAPGALLVETASEPGEAAEEDAAELVTAAEPALDPEAQIAQIQERVWAMRRARRAQVGFVRRRSRGRARH